MNLFEAVKQSVTTRQAAEHYGIHIGRNGMACCPFHHDKTPSMKLDRRYHCFGCGADGDVIDFAAALYGLFLIGCLWMLYLLVRSLEAVYLVDAFRAGVTVVFSLFLLYIVFVLPWQVCLMLLL